MPAWFVPPIVIPAGLILLFLVVVAYKAYV